MPKVSLEQRSRGLVAVDGLIIGELHGSVNGIFRGTIDGEVDVRLLSGKIVPAESSGQPILPEKPTAETEKKGQEGDKA